jgi:excisionase family DNA binding protein
MPEPFAYSIQDACNVFSIGRTRIYELLSCGHLEGRKLGKKTLISASSLKAYFNGLPVAEVHVTLRETTVLRKQPGGRQMAEICGPKVRSSKRRKGKSSSAGREAE